MSLFKTSTDFVLNRLYNFISHLNLGDTMNYFQKDYTQNCITTTSDGRNKLYGVCLETTSNITKSFDVKRTANNGSLLLSIVKKDGIAKIYVFSTNNIILLDIADKFNTKLLDPDELISAIYSIFLIDCFKVEDKRVKNFYEKEEIEAIDYDPLHIIFPQMLKNASANLLRDYKPYQATGYQMQSEYSVIKLLNAEWEGVIYFMLDFGEDAVKELFTQHERNAKLIDAKYLKQIKELKSVQNTEVLRELYEQTAVINTIAFVKDHIQLHNIERQLSIKFEPKYLGMDKILPKTMLRSRDIDFDFLVPREWATQLLSSALQKDALALANLNRLHPIVDFAGRDIQGSFVNYTFKQSINPHSLVFGSTGIGKSVSVLKILAQLIDFDFETKTAHKLSKTRKIRYSNVGYTGGRIFASIEEQAINENKNLIQKMDSNLENLRFSLFEFENTIPSEDEIKQLEAFFDLVLGYEQKDNSLTEMEKSIFAEALKTTCSNYEAHGTTVTVMELDISQRFGDDYKKIVKEILSEKDENGNLLYKETTKLHELSDKYKRFKHPTLGDLISNIEKLSVVNTKTEIEKQAAMSLHSKLNQLKQNKLYANYSNIDLKSNTPLYYAEFDRIKNYEKEFVTIGWLLITTWFNQDKEEALRCEKNGENRPDSYYFIDEAHNFLKHPKFKDLFDVWSREMRKYGCHLMLISQSATDIDTKVANFFATKFFIFTDRNKGETYSELKYLNGGNELKKDEKEIFDMIDNHANSNRVIFMQHTGGTTAFSLPELKGYEDYFRPYDF